MINIPPMSPPKCDPRCGPTASQCIKCEGACAHEEEWRDAERERVYPPPSPDYERGYADGFAAAIEECIEAYPDAADTLRIVAETARRA